MDQTNDQLIQDYDTIIHENPHETGAETKQESSVNGSVQNKQTKLPTIHPKKLNSQNEGWNDNFSQLNSFKEDQNAEG